MAKRELTLTLGERCLLRNQYAILALLKPDHAEFFKQAQHVVEQGWEHDYAEFLLEDVSTEPMPSERCGEIRRILDMYIAMQRGLPVGDDAGKRALFPGFPSAEIHEQAYVKWMLGREEYEPLSVSGVYDALPQLGRYRAMLRIYDSWNNPGELTSGQSDVLLKAYDETRAYP